MQTFFQDAGLVNISSFSWHASKKKNGVAGNIPLDLASDHFNRILKTLIKKPGANGLNEKALNRHCKILTTNKHLLGNSDEMCNIKRMSGYYVHQVGRNDLAKTVKNLV